jgi:outer membrane protein assembly factor BamB
MMRLAGLMATVMLLGAAWPRGVEGQVPRGLIPAEAARQAGLTRAWFTRLPIDAARGSLAGIYLHVSPSEAHTVFEVADEGERYVYSERDLDAFGRALGVEEARRLAEEKAEQIQKERNLAAAPSVQSYVIPRMRLYAASHRGGLMALDAHTGQTLWAIQVGNPNYPTTPAGANDTFVAVCNGSTIYIFLAKDGTLVWSRQAVSAPGAGPALSEQNYLFAPMLSGQVEILSLEDPRDHPRVVKSFGRVLSQPTVSALSVAWSSDEGYLYVANANGEGVRYQLRASGPVLASPAFAQPDRVYATSLDGYLYCVQERRGNLLWRFSTGEPIHHPPVALGDLVLVITRTGKMYALDGATAVERWVASGIEHYLAGSERRLYCLDRQGQLVALDRASGQRLGAIDARGCDLPILNAQTDRIFLASKSGLLQCLHEADRPWPQVHWRLPPPARRGRPAMPTKAPGEDRAEPAPRESAPSGEGPARGGADTASPF